jgi:Leucine-rich repeat (LRR) protein
LSALEELVIKDMAITGLPESLGRLPSLHTLILRDTCIKSLPPDIAGLENLAMIVCGEPKGWYKLRTVSLQIFLGA